MIRLGLPKAEGVDDRPSSLFGNPSVAPQFTQIMLIRSRGLQDFAFGEVVAGLRVSKQRVDVLAPRREGRLT